MSPFISFVAVIGLALIHVFSAELRFLDRVPRSRFLSFAGGVSVALVFLEILPELGESQETIARALGPVFGFLRNHIYIIALLGLATFYGVQGAISTSRQQQQAAGKGDTTSDGIFWLSISVVASKNAIAGYLLLREERPVLRLLLFVAALALEFTLTDRGLHRDHKANYDQRGRWVVAAAVILGWLIGYLTEVPAVGIAILNAFLAGFIIENVLKEELPAERQSRFWAFALGAGVYAALLLVQ